MKSLFTYLSGFAGPAAGCALFLFLPGGLSQPASSCAQVPDDGAEVLTRGPVHEAFAGTISFKAVKGFPVPEIPPEAVDELAPEHRPDGANVTWIPGYWAWDEEATEFIWVSGIWRNLPPGRQWIPGYWWESGREHQWISGYWADADVEEVEYLEQPPASLEKGPNIKAPSRNHSWVPGTWRYRNSRYAWQGGYWNEVRPNWIWVPSYYTSTPRGHIYVDGYYDYDVPRRGVIFAPVRFQGERYTQPDYHYRPTTVISVSAVINHLFLRPKARHYYFGDYYAPEYRRSGYYSSSNYYTGGHGYDPIYSHQRWTHREDTSWERRTEENFVYYRDHEEERPPHTLSAFTQFYDRPDRSRRVEQGFATRLDQFITRNDSNIKFQALEQSEQELFTRRSRELREYGDERRKSLIGFDPGIEGERPVKEQRGNKKENRPAEPVRIKLEKSPVLAAEVENAPASDTPPPRPASAPAQDPAVSRGKDSPVKSNEQDADSKPPVTKTGEDPAAPPVTKTGEDPAAPPASEKAPKTGPDNISPEMDRKPRGDAEAEKKPDPDKDPNKSTPDKPNPDPDSKDPTRKVPPIPNDGPPPGTADGKRGKSDKDDAAPPRAMPPDSKRGDQPQSDPALPRPPSEADPQRGPEKQPAGDKKNDKPDTLGDKGSRKTDPIPPPSKPDPSGDRDAIPNPPQPPNSEPQRQGRDKQRSQDTSKPRKPANIPEERRTRDQPESKEPSRQKSTPRAGEPQPQIPSPSDGPKTKPMPTPDSDRERPGAEPRREAPMPEKPMPDPRRNTQQPEPRREPVPNENRREKPSRETRQEPPNEPKANPRREAPVPQSSEDNGDRKNRPRRESAPQVAPGSESREQRREPKGQPQREEKPRPSAEPAPQAKPQPGPSAPLPSGNNGNPPSTNEKKKKDKD